MRKFELTSPISHAPEAPVGSIVYEAKGYDYGLASDDTRMTGVKHISVTLREDGGIPTFTAPVTSLKEVV